MTDVDEPPWWNESNKAKTWDGLIAVRPNGQALLHGGHHSGRGWAGKTEFPASWTRADMERAAVIAWTDPDAVYVSGDRRTVRRLVDGVIVEVSAYGAGYKDFRAVVPKNGAGIMMNRTKGGGADQMPLEMAILNEEGWNHVER